MSLRALLIGLLTSTAVSAIATAASADPPGRVGRVAYVEGGVSMLPPQTDAWAWAAPNYPVAPSESFWTGDDGRAQLQIGSVDTRLDSDTELDVLDLDYGEMRLALPQGSLDIRLWSTPRGGVTIATPAGDVRLDAQGLYRVDVGAPQSDGSYPTVEVTVFDGQADAPSPEGPAPVYAGQAAVLYAGYDPQMQDAQDAAIDDWGYQREAQTGWQPEDDSAAAVTGMGDLYAAGDFVQDPQFGRVWFPRDVPPDWAPYRYGHWAYVQPWGYTWIDDESWGFAPFHYGRWAQFGGRWGWVPGRPTPEPVYAPALVAFLGGVGWSLGGSDAIGWVPLGPDEIYRPSYAVSNDYWRRMNAASVRPNIINSVTINTVVVNTYRNAPAATVVRAAAFSGGQSAQHAAIPVTAAVIAAAPAASAANRPPPSAAVRAGPTRPTGAGGSAAPAMAARPPAALQAVHAAVAAPPTGTGKPPVIAGARIAAAPPPPRAAGAAVAVAPAQARRPMAPSTGSRPGPASRPGPGPGRGPATMAPSRPEASPRTPAPAMAPRPIAAQPPAVRPVQPTPASREPPQTPRMAPPVAGEARRPAVDTEVRPPTTRPPVESAPAPRPPAMAEPRRKPQERQAPVQVPTRAPVEAAPRAKPPEAGEPVRPVQARVAPMATAAHNPAEPAARAKPKPAPDAKKREGEPPNPQP